MNKSTEKHQKNVEKHRKTIESAADFLWKNPETGYKEWKTQEYLAEKFQTLGYELNFASSVPGFYTDLDTGVPGPTLLFMAEMDALPVEGHPAADPETGAAHACGHHAQGAGLVGVAAAMKEPGALDGLCGKIRFMAVPAEELVEVEYRENLRKQGIIRYFGGKQEFFSRGYMDDVDFCALIHVSNRPAGTADMHLGQNGCLLKTVEFCGKASHAGSAPHKGVNALYAANLAMNAINALRETFPQEEQIRVHPVITHGGSAVSAIPDRVQMDTYVRGATVEGILRENRKINRAIAGAALSMGANAILCDRPGYLPVHQHPAVTEVAMQAMELALGKENVSFRNTFGCGSSDMGDMTAVLPTAYIHVGGAVGQAHGKDYAIASVESACVNSAKIFALLAQTLLENGGEKLYRVKEAYTPLYPHREAYCAALDRIFLDTHALTYRDDGTVLA